MNALCTVHRQDCMRLYRHACIHNNLEPKLGMHNLKYTCSYYHICDRICKKGSYTRTTSTHRFHHHSIDTLSDYPWVHVLWPTVHQSAFPEAVSGACQTSMNARFVTSCPCWLLNKGHPAVRSHTTL